MAAPRHIPIQVPIVAALLALAFFSIYLWRIDQRGDPDRMVVSGTVEADEVEVGSKIGGRLHVIHVREGDEVTRGQLLAQFDVDELLARRRQLAAGKSAAEAQELKLRNGPRVQELTQARASIEAAAAQLRQLEAGSRAEDIAAAQASWRAAEAQATQAAADLERAHALFAQDVIPRSELDVAQARSESARRNADAAHEQYAKAEAGPRREEIDAARARVRQVQAAYDLLVAGSRAEDIAAAGAQVAATEAEIDVLAVQVAESKVFAPVNGAVLRQHKQPGDLVQPGQPVFTLLLTGSYYVQVFVPEDKLSWAQPGTQVDLQVDTFPGETFAGEVTYLATQGEFTPRNLQTTEKRVEQTFRCKVVVEATGRLRPGMVGDVIFARPGDA